MEDKINKAVELFKEGYNCSQSVVAAFAEDYGFTKEQAEEIKKTYSTPFHIYDEKGIRENVKAVKVLPYHNYAEAKYEALNIENTLPDTLPTNEEIEKALSESNEEKGEQEEKSHSK